MPSADPVFPSSTAFENELVTGAPETDIQDTGKDIAKSFPGVGLEPFETEVTAVLLAPVQRKDIEVRPDGQAYLPEIKYRRILNQAFGPGGWGLVPRGPHTLNAKNISREYALFARGRFVAQARGEQDYFGEASLPTAAEGCKSNALMRCCKDLGVASELWDPSFVHAFRRDECVLVPAINMKTKEKINLWRRKDGNGFEWPFKEDKR
ncbi:hypothetical protein HK104_005913 [Borealophlyctis nickersoniae]|nr:hypothetical protein HK104_005913 [Borealophlyctis nickersoniae]